MENSKLENNERLHNLRHSAAHLLAQAVLEIYPETKITIGPVTDNGFFYDFLPTKNFKEEDLSLIESKMHEIANRDYKIRASRLVKMKRKSFFMAINSNSSLSTGLLTKL